MLARRDAQLPVQAVPGDKPVRRPPVKVQLQPMTARDYLLIKHEIVAQHPRAGYGYLLLTKVLYNSGLRISEVLRLRVEDIVEERAMTFLRVVRSKKRVPVAVEIPLHPELAAELKEFVRGNGRRRGMALLPYYKRTYERAFKAAALAATGRGFTPHQLRHLYTKTLLDGGMPVALVAKLLGHENVETTLGSYYDVTREEWHRINSGLEV